MAVRESYLTYVADQLTGVGQLRSRRMFGGVGFYCGDLFFGLLDDDALYFKVDDTNRGDFVARGMGPFCPYPDRPDQAMGYFEVPADVIEDAEELVEWARKAIRVATAVPRKSKAPNVKPRSAIPPNGKPRKATPRRRSRR